MSLDHRAAYVRSILASLVATIGLVPLGLWARHLDIGPGTVPLFDATGRSYWLAGILFTIVAAGLFQALDRDSAYAMATASARGVRYEPASELPTAWVIPLVATITGVMLLAIYHSQAAIACVALGLFVIVATGSISRRHLFDADPWNRGRARGVYTILVHVVAFFALSMVYINKVRSLFSATAVLIVAVLLLMQTHRGRGCALRAAPRLRAGWRGDAWPDHLGAQLLEGNRLDGRSGVARLLLPFRRADFEPAA